MRMRSSACVALGLAALAALASVRGIAASGEDGSRLLTIDHYVRINSKVASIAGQTSTIYVREKVRAGNALRGATAAD